MNYEDRIFELYKIYIPIMYDYQKNYGDPESLRRIREDALEVSFKSIEYFNDQINIQKEKQNGKRDNGND